MTLCSLIFFFYANYTFLLRDAFTKLELCLFYVLVHIYQQHTYILYFFTVFYQFGVRNCLTLCIQLIKFNLKYLFYTVLNIFL